MDKLHLEILAEIKKIAPHFKNFSCSRGFNLGSYMGTSKPMYDLTNPEARQIAKNWVNNNQDISFEEYIKFLDSLFAGESHDERSFGGRILEYTPKLRKQIDPQVLDKWLTGAEGWGEVDSLCQSSFPADEILAKWSDWKKLITKFSQDKDIHKRRASLVLLTMAVRHSADPRLSRLAFTNIGKLKKEKELLITRAISWLLRDLIKNHKSKVAKYLEKNQETLPKIAVREVTRKLLTGKK